MTLLINKHTVLEQAIKEADLLGADTIILPKDVAVMHQRNMTHISDCIAHAIYEHQSDAAKANAMRALRHIFGVPLSEAKDMLEGALNRTYAYHNPPHLSKEPPDDI